eukprot:5198873-Prymnesium_polylepis.2
MHADGSSHPQKVCECAWHSMRSSADSSKDTSEMRRVDLRRIAVGMCGGGGGWSRGDRACAPAASWSEGRTEPRSSEARDRPDGVCQSSEPSALA